MESTNPQHVHIQRFPATAAISQLVAPHDRSWAVQVGHDGEAVFFRQVPNSDTPEPIGGYGEGVQHVYVDAELPSVAVEDAVVLPQDEGIRAPHDPGVIDYTVTAGKEGDYPGAKEGYWAWLNVRACGYWGETEHEAVRALINGVARLCTAGSLDHTGRPVLGNPRRRRAVNGT